MPVMKRVLVRVPQWLGDAVVSTVFLRRLKEKHPETNLIVLAPSFLVDIFSSHPSVQSVVSYQRGDSPFRVGASVRQHDIDRIYVLPRSLRTALEAWSSGIPERIGFGGDLRRLLFTSSVKYEPSLLYAHRYLKLIDEEYLPLQNTRPYFPNQPPRPENSEVAEFFAKAPRPFLGIGPASVAPARTWDAVGFAHVAERFLKERGGSVVLFGSPSELNVAARVKSALRGSVLDATGRLNFPELGWAVKQCDHMLVNDSGLMHVASCFEIPTTVLFGASDPARALPTWGRFGALQHKEVPCVPCLRNHCVRFGSGHNECLKRISVEEVWDALKD